MYRYHIGTMRVKIYHNQSILQIINNTDETIHYIPQLSMGIVDIRSLGYYNVTKSVCSLTREEIIRFLLLLTKYLSYTHEITTKLVKIDR